MSQPVNFKTRGNRSNALLCLRVFVFMHEPPGVGGVDCLHLHTKMQKNVFIYLWVCFQTFKMCIYIFLSILPIIFRLHFWSVLFSISRCRPKRRTFYGNVFIRGGSMATNDPQQGRRLTLGPRNKTFEIRNISYPLVLLTCPASQYFIWKSIRLS